LTVVFLSAISGASAQNELTNSLAYPPTSDFSNTVVPITAFRFAPSVKSHFLAMPSPSIGGVAAFGTGFCLDEVCRFVVTNYHVAKMSSVRKIKGRRIIHRYLATGKDDKEATLRFLPPDNFFPYAVKRDLALYELDRPIKGHHGLKFTLDDLQPGEEVDIYGYPLGLKPVRSLVRVPARFKANTTSGLLAFEYDRSVEKPLRVRGGSSGGIVVDRKTQRIVGVLCEGNETEAMAVPIRNLVDFVSKVQPFVSVKTFPAFKNIPPEAVDIYPKFEPQPDFNPSFVPGHTGTLQHRPIESPDITRMRENAQRLADSIQNFIAVQSYSWGSGDKEPKAYAEYEVRVTDGMQSFRKYPDGKKDSAEVPVPRLPWSASGSDEWAKLPKMLGTEYKLRIRRAEDSEINGSKIQVFQYRAEVEDKLCRFEPTTDYGLFQITNLVELGCHGEAWVDQEGNILRISLNFELSDKRKEYQDWTEYKMVLTYGPVKIEDEPVRLAPLTILTEGQNGKRIEWCRGTFSNYRLFASHSRLLTATESANQMEQK